MKKNILTIAFVLTSVLLFAQTEITLQINHKLGTDAFDFNQESENNLGDAFEVTRLEYYISQISISHDDGIVTSIDDTWILVDAATTTIQLLGDYDITDVESISFGIGVEAAVNHLDPSAYDSDHPLAPQSPSMHWGWAAGYRYVALEGNVGATLNELLQIHALGDVNYNEQTIELDLSANNGNLIISLDADYAEALNNINISSGLINHGESNEAADLLDNFQDLVFTPTPNTTAIDELDAIQLSIYPNPVKANGQLFISDDSNISSIRLIDFSGRVVQQWSEVKGFINLDQAVTGVYLLSIQTLNGSEVTKKVIVE